MEQALNIARIKRVAPALLSLPSKQVWANYDDEADVLYLSFAKPQHATDSEQRDDVIVHYRGRRVVGLTILNASKHDVHAER